MEFFKNNTRLAVTLGERAIEFFDISNLPKLNHISSINLHIINILISSIKLIFINLYIYRL